MDIGKLIVCGNQIGNLFDLPSKSIEFIKNSKNIICDTRDRFINEIINPLGIDISDKNLFAFEPELSNTDEILNFAMLHIGNGEDVVFICDAGMPGVSDWGTQLVSAMHNSNISVEIIPGPSILTTAIAIAGIPARTEKIFYAGFMEQPSDEVESTLKATQALRPCLVLIDHPQDMGRILSMVDSVYNNPFVSLCINITMLNQKIMRGNAKDILDEYKKLDNFDCFMTLVVDGS